MIEQAEHTPGPWWATEGLECPIVDSANCIIAGCHVAACHLERPMAEGKSIANARLIAAAPEMAEMLLHSLNILESTTHGSAVPIPEKWAKWGPDETFRQIRAVLQKAGVLNDSNGEETK